MLQCCRDSVLVEVVILVLAEVVIPAALAEVVAVNTRDGKPSEKIYLTHEYQKCSIGSAGMNQQGNIANGGLNHDPPL